MSNLDRASIRTWITPITTAVFFVLAVTGLLMAFKLRGPIHPIHEWMGYLFCIAAAVHIVLNWRPLVNTFRGTKAVAVIAVVVLLSIGIWAAAGSGHDQHKDWQEHGQGRPASQNQVDIKSSETSLVHQRSGSPGPF